MQVSGPLQDTPAIKAIYNAIITVKDPLVLKMSGMKLFRLIMWGIFQSITFNKISRYLAY